jgi:hypothetical protein
MAIERMARTTLFAGPVGEGHARIWLEPDARGLVLRTHEWGPDVERWFGSDAIETCLRIGADALVPLTAALVMDHPETDPGATPSEVISAAYRGDAAASAHLRQRLDALSLPYEFEMT